MNTHDRIQVDKLGRITRRPDTSEMLAPYECTRCGCVHDAGPVEVVARYMDCTVWKCPGCGSHIDDRPIGWGGSARKVER